MGSQGTQVRRGAGVRAAMTLLFSCLALGSLASAQDTTRYSHADTLRGSNGPARAWWDVQFYDLHTRVNPRDSSIAGWNGITYRVLPPGGGREMQIDLQVPMAVDSIDRKSTRLNSSHLVISYAVFCLKKKKKRNGLVNQDIITMSDLSDN